MRKTEFLEKPDPHVLDGRVFHESTIFRLYGRPMRALVRFLAVLVFVCGFQSGIVTSAASALKWSRTAETLSVPAVDAVEADVASAETPWPSCKSMTGISETACFVPRPRPDTARTPGRDERRGLWRTLSIDEPPKAFSTKS